MFVVRIAQDVTWNTRYHYVRPTRRTTRAIRNQPSEAVYLGVESTRYRWQRPAALAAGALLAGGAFASVTINDGAPGVGTSTVTARPATFQVAGSALPELPPLAQNEEVIADVQPVAASTGAVRVATPAPPEASTSAVHGMPTPQTVGAPHGRSFSPMSSGSIVSGGTYDGVDISGGFEIGRGQAPTTFTNCVIRGSIVVFSPITLVNCTVLGGLYAYDTYGTITSTLIDSDTNQAFRPGTEDQSLTAAYGVPTPWVVTDSYLRIKQGVAPNHTEASQVLGGVGITFRNVVFDTGGPFNNTQTADLNFHGKDLLCEDCWFIGYGGYAIYSEGPNNVFLRPKFARNYQWGILYPSSRVQPTIVDARHLDGSPA